MQANGLAANYAGVNAVRAMSGAGNITRRERLLLKIAQRLTTTREFLVSGLTQAYDVQSIPPLSNEVAQDTRHKEHGVMDGHVPSDEEGESGKDNESGDGGHLDSGDEEVTFIIAKYISIKCHLTFLTTLLLSLCAGKTCSEKEGGGAKGGTLVVLAQVLLLPVDKTLSSIRRVKSRIQIRTVQKMKMRKMRRRRQGKERGRYGCCLGVFDIEVISKDGVAVAKEEEEKQGR